MSQTDVSQTDEPSLPAPNPGGANPGEANPGDANLGEANPGEANPGEAKPGAPRSQKNLKGRNLKGRNLKGRNLKGRNLRGLLLGAIAVAAAVGVGWVTIWLASQGSVESNLGDDELRLGDHLRLSERIEQGPILWPGLTAGAPDFYLQHLGDDPRRGWSAFDASWPESGCAYVWNDQADWFEPERPNEPECAGLGIVEADGGGLRQYAVRLDAEGRVVVRFVSAELG